MRPLPWLNQNPLEIKEQKITGEIVEKQGIQYYRIEHIDEMLPFFMTLTGAGDHWMYVSSNGALTAGRRDPANSLFPYTTDDKITDSAEVTGCKTIIRIHEKDKDYLWEPLSYRFEKLYPVTRNLYKSIYGNILLFEEINHLLKIAFSYSWQFSNRYGFIRTSKIQNLREKALDISILDGIQNILPYGVDEGMQLTKSTLVDAYKRQEIHSASGLGIYYLNSIPTDKAEPSESLKATTVLSAGLGKPIHLLSATQIADFRSGKELIQEDDIRGMRGAYFISKRLPVKGKEECQWIIVANLEQDHEAIFGLIRELKTPDKLLASVYQDLFDSTRQLIELTGKADGLQGVRDPLISTRHFANVLFNCMRGGTFLNQYRINTKDLILSMNHFNKNLPYSLLNKLAGLKSEILFEELISVAENSGNADFQRLCYEYLPLSFSRRHGDPSRPWNRFSIRNRDHEGNPLLNYEGNWRDIFQNWEALAYSFPEFTESMICRFLNASTADGYNPYRITKQGIDWEVPDPGDPWSNIGYWGDHQIIYLLKLLEISEDFHPGILVNWLTREFFVYTLVPYRIKNYITKIKNPRDTILFDTKVENTCLERSNLYGADGKLHRLNNAPYKVNLAEKLLVPILVKLSNFVIGGGIWLNNQRPEWNDANNALVGNGLSMVTVYHLRRHILFIRDLFSQSPIKTINISAEVAQWIQDIHQIYKEYQVLTHTEISPRLRRTMLDALGKAEDKYHAKIYGSGFSGEKIAVDISFLDSLFTLVLKSIDASITENRREDKLFHAYNLMKVGADGGISINHLHEMLEGQVAILNSGYLNASRSLELLEAIRNSLMYRSDQSSYTLYPDRILPRFLEKNLLESSDISSFKLIGECIKKQDHRIIKPNGDGGFQFNGNFKNSADLVAVLESLKNQYDPGLIDKEKEALVQLFENTFTHHSFTGRSGTFFKYEGLGSIYWHMVSKFVLAIQEVCFRAVEANEDKETCRKLAGFYFETREGLGVHKSPDAYGAFPTDPYSHTPKHAGAQQPGMTGQVKEDLLSRWGELGIRIKKGRLCFAPVLLKKEEFLKVNQKFTYVSLEGELSEMDIPDNALAFTYCQVPVVYHIQKGSGQVVLHYKNGKPDTLTDLSLPVESSQKIFKRTGEIELLEVFIGLFTY